jgi:hypothetical protein
MSEARLLSLVLLAVFSAFINDGILFSIYLLFNIFIIYFLLLSHLENLFIYFPFFNPTLSCFFF